MKLKRSELYLLVWTMPVTRIATMLSLSDQAVSKACVRSNIPVPGRGHWQRVSAGKAVERIALPDPNAHTDLLWELNPALDAALHAAAALPSTPQKVVMRMAVDEPTALRSVPASQKLHFASARTEPARRRRPPNKRPSPSARVALSIAGSGPNVGSGFEPAGRNEGNENLALQQLFEVLERLIPHLQPATAGVLQAWIEQLKEQVRANDPVAEALAVCALISNHGERYPMAT